MVKVFSEKLIWFYCLGRNYYCLGDFKNFILAFKDVLIFV